MLRNHRSVSQILQKHHLNDNGPSKALLQSEQRQRRQSNELNATANSKPSFVEAKTSSKGLQASRRNKSLSCSKLKLFEKAREVGKGQSFLKTPPKTIVRSTCLSASTSQLREYHNVRRQGKVQEAVEKKLIIDRVVRSMQEDSSVPRLSIRGELEQRRQARQPALPEKLSQSRLPEELVYSKDFGVEDESRTDGWQGQRLSVSRDEQAFRVYSKELTVSISESVKKEMEEVYLTRERELEQRYLEKEQQYLEKFKDLEIAMEVKLERERALLLQNINVELEKQFEKAREAREGREGRNDLRQEEVKVDHIRRKESTTVQEDRIANEAKVVQLIKPDPVASKSRKGSREIAVLEEEPILQAKPVERPTPVLAKESSKGRPVDPPRQLKKQQKSAKGSEKAKSIYKQVDSDMMDYIEEVNLDFKPSKGKEQGDRINKSFNVENKHDNSFSSERPPVRKEKEPPKPAPMKRQPSEQEKRKAEEEQRKAAVRVKLKEYSEFDPLMVGMGEVTGYCSKFCKKSKVDWRMPSLLLYRYCLDLFRSYKPTFEEAERLRLVRRDQLENYRSYDAVMEANLEKMLKSFQKKVAVPEAYRQIVESSAIELDRLRPHAIRESKRYVEELRQSSESSAASGDLDVVQCGLRVIKSVYVIRRINGEAVDLISREIGELSRQESFQLFEEWSLKLRQEK